MTDNVALDARAVSHDLLLEVHPSVVFKLGEDLISDEVQALVELVKNCYDADSPFAHVDIDTTFVADNRLAWPNPGQTRPDANDAMDENTAPLSHPRDDVLLGRISVEDRGTGMTLAEITRGWLTISNSLKREMKASGARTKRGRTPLGDKGLGRLGAQRLGRYLEIITVPATGSQQFRVRVDWSAFADAETLSAVPIRVYEEPVTRRVGTLLRIDGLRDVDLWRGERLVGVQRELSTLISPYEGTRGFEVTVVADGQTIDLREIPRRIREAAHLHYSFSYDHQTLSVQGQARLSYFRPVQSDEVAEYLRLVEHDAGQSFLNWLRSTQPDQCRELNLQGDSPSDGGWFAKYSLTRRLKDIKALARCPDGSAFADPGPFSGEVDAVDLNREAGSAFGNLSDYRRFVREINGIRIYRDGFGIRVDQDWLGLGKRWSSGKSYYNLQA